MNKRPKREETQEKIIEDVAFWYGLLQTAYAPVCCTAVSVFQIFLCMVLRKAQHGSERGSRRALRRRPESGLRGRKGSEKASCSSDLSGHHSLFSFHTLFPQVF